MANSSDLPQGSSRHPRLPRLLPDLLNALRRHVRLLEAFSNCAFQQGNSDYLGAVAGTLRVLVCKSGARDRPLLTDLMSEFEVEIPLPDEMYPPIDDRPRNLREFLARLAFFIAMREAPVEFTYEQLISTWANQSGAAHEDWDWTRQFTADRNIGLLLFGHPPAVHALRLAAKTVAYFAETFLSRLSDDLIRDKSARYALSVSQQALCDFPSSEAAIRHVRAKEFCILQQFEDSLHECDVIIERNPDDAVAHHGRGMALLLLKRAREAIDAFTHALGLGYESPELHYNLACAYAVARAYPQCLHHLEQLEKLGDSPSDLDPFEDPDFANIRDDQSFGAPFAAVACRLRNRSTP